MSGLGDALQQIGAGMMNRGFAKRDEQKAEQIRQKQAAEDQAQWEQRQAFLARLRAPEERQREVYNEQLQKAQIVREQWDGNAGAWKESGRDEKPPTPGEKMTFRQGDEEVTALVDPTTGKIVSEIGRGSAFSPSQRRGGSMAQAGGEESDGNVSQAGPGRSPNRKGAPSGYMWSEDGASLVAIPGGPAEKKPEGAKPPGQQMPAEIRQKLGLIDNALRNAQEYKKRVVGEGGTFRDIDARLDNTPGLLTSAIQDMLYVKSGASAPVEEVKKWESVYGPGVFEKDKTAAAKVDQLLADIHGLRDQYVSQSAKQEPGAAPQEAAATGHKVGDVIEFGGKRYRVVGGSPDDPDLEEL